MPGRRNQVRVIVVAIGEMSALFEEEVPPILRFEVCTIPIQVVPTKLVKYQHYNELRLRIIRIGSQPRAA